MTDWLGTGAADTAATGNLCTLTELQDFLGDSAGAFESDALNAAIESASALIQRYCDRVFAAADYREWERISGNVLSVDNYPIIHLHRICKSSYQAGTLVNSSTDAAAMTATVGENYLLLQVIGGTNAHSDALTLTTYTTMALLATAVSALAKGWTLSVVKEAAPRDLKPSTTSAGNNNQIQLEAPDNPETVSDIDYDAGLIMGIGDGWVFADYRGGYETMPYDIRQACIQLAGSIAKAGGLNMQLSSERLGDYAYTLANGTTSTLAGLLGGLTVTLDGYRRRGA